MRAAIYNPYLDTLGGGERYTMSVASILKKFGWEVDVQWSDPGIGRQIEDRFGINLDGVNFVPDIKTGNGYDLCFWLSDGSIPLLHARKNILHFQVPFQRVGGRSLLNRMKLYRINKIVCNSMFTKRFIDREYGVDSLVVYPPVQIEKFKPKRKENIILYVGRFSKLKQSKRQDILVEVFKKLIDFGLSGWRLILAGGSDVGGKEFVRELRELSEGLPIEILENPNFKKTVELFGKASIFWSAAGYGISEDINPEKVEHFGIVLVEAMASKTVPIVFAAGGHREIVEEGVNGLLWVEKKDLLKKTKDLISSKATLSKLASNAKLSSQKFSYERFEKEIALLV